ncbi:MAG: phosphoadenosine phosphosulfate reductase family protein [Anaerolineales bacterium]|nr:phosphoadenosine phosphosulfate reductase family protein [Anaerolineales bacterium]
MRTQPTLFENSRMTLRDAIDLTVMSMQLYAEKYRHWSISYSGGKDSSATLAIVLHLLESGLINKPDSLTVLYADTGLELLPLHHTAIQILTEVEKRGYRTAIVRPELDKRFFVYMFGRGVPPPSNVFRWCTGALKIKPMMDALQKIRVQTGEKFLSLIGVRLGESAARDQRIAIACGKDAECGQGYYQETTPANVADVLAPIVHWRTCHVWDLLQGFGPPHGLPTEQIASIYGLGTELEEISSRTGCTACNLASRDIALDRILHLPDWRYLAPLKRLKPLYAELRQPYRRLRKTKAEYNAAGNLVSNLHRLGPMTMETRRWGLSQVLKIQDEINKAANGINRPEITLVDTEELARINELIEANTWPDKWSGDEETGDILHNQIVAEGVVQPLIISGD